MYATLIKPLFFLLPPERAHHLTLWLFRFGLALPGIGHWLRRAYRLDHPALRRELFGLSFENPIGLAAGFDKDGKHYRTMAHLGFGFIELGTVTPKGQEGNPQPRLFRLPADHALINRMGFNNDGVEQLVERLQKYGKPPGLIIGGNIGKNKLTPNETAAQDYEYCFEALFPYVDYFVVNVSSPNTPNLRELQDKAPLSALLHQLQALNRARPKPKPLLLKIAPDLNDSQLDDILDIAKEVQLDGLIATNTTIDRSKLDTPAGQVESIGAGGLSGRPLADRSTHVIRYLSQRSKGQLSIIGVGGIDSPQQAIEKLEAGAVLLQIYTGLVYQGPGLVRRINQALIDRQG